ncbi:hypothetical protein TNCV_1799111 [Trichonephila clavipes]|uniref:Uncharacterized protein n=1 Tax=Trichonephila clavipes TaxID=2585209 RepID=A0A8X6VM00_TRICX|nr:hypothetical protein TNCV_1799111 [Trichonephila clavipes]
MPDHRSFQRLHRQLRETHSFLVARHDAGQRRPVRSSSLEESILNFLVNKSESSQAVAHHKVRAFNPAIFSNCQWVVQRCALQLDFMAHVRNSYEQLL